MVISTQAVIEDYLAFRDGVLWMFEQLNEPAKDPRVKMMLAELGREEYREGPKVGEGFQKVPDSFLAELRTEVERWKAARK